MPHLHLETTADVVENADIPDILEALCAELCTNDSVESSKTRAYHTLRSVWYMGQGAPISFVHLTVSVLSGRDLSWRKQVGKGLMEVLRQRFEYSLGEKEVQITLDVREMEKETYLRVV